MLSGTGLILVLIRLLIWSLLAHSGPCFSETCPSPECGLPEAMPAWLHPCGWWNEPRMDNWPEWGQSGSLQGFLGLWQEKQVRYLEYLSELWPQELWSGHIPSCRYENQTLLIFESEAEMGAGERPQVFWVSWNPAARGWRMPVPLWYLFSLARVDFCNSHTKNLKQ